MVILTVIIGVTTRFHQETGAPISRRSADFRSAGVPLPNGERRSGRRERKQHWRHALTDSLHVRNRYRSLPVRSIRCAEHPLPGGQAPLIERNNRPGGYESISRRGPFRTSRRSILIRVEAAQGMISGESNRRIAVRSEVATHWKLRTSRPGTCASWRLARAVPRKLPQA